MAADLALLAGVPTGVAEVVTSKKQGTAPALGALTVFQPVRSDPTTGKLTGGNGTDAAHAALRGLATATVAAGMPLTYIRNGILYGIDLSTFNFGDKVYLSDAGGLNIAAGTVVTVVGEVVPVFNNDPGGTPKKALDVQLI